MAKLPTVGSAFDSLGVTRRELLRFSATAAALLALPTTSVTALADALVRARRPSVIWLSFQECTGCTESLTRAHAPTIEELILQLISLDYHHTLQAASGQAAEEARKAAMAENFGRYILVVDGALPLDHPEYSTIAGIDNRTMLEESAKGAAAVIAVGSCASFGGLPAAQPNPTGAVPVSAIVTDKPLLHLPGCPPIPAVISAVVAHFLTFSTLPELDGQLRPKAFYGETIHDRCYRRPFYDQGLFAESFDDEGARQGWCLFKLGCKGPTTYNACATLRWNHGTSFPIQSGHGCLGCSEARFWDAGDFYKPISTPIEPVDQVMRAAAVGGAGVGGALIGNNLRQRRQAEKAHQPVGIDDLEKES
ncbi:MAG: hydrogenase small subunit [Magnetococcales bacterium]|nr:hydrogenase small subunit [Magnetococcales bacterium]